MESIGEEFLLPKSQPAKVFAPPLKVEHSRHRRRILLPQGSELLVSCLLPMRGKCGMETGSPSSALPWLHTMEP